MYAIGQINFLFDPTQRPHLTADELAAGIGVVKSTMANKASVISKTLDLGMYEPDLTRAAMIEQHPLARIIEVDGFLVGARTLPPEVQERARELGPDPRPADQQYRTAASPADESKLLSRCRAPRLGRMAVVIPRHHRCRCC